MNIKTRMTQQDYIKVSFMLLWKRLIVKIYAVIFALSLLLYPIRAAVFSDYSISFSQITFPVIVLILFPLFTYINAKRNFNANKRMGEEMEYRFEKDDLIIKGESFTVQQSWDKIYKVTQTKNWVLIWQTRRTANPIPKRDIWEGEIHDLKELLDGHGVKNNL